MPISLLLFYLYYYHVAIYREIQNNNIYVHLYYLFNSRCNPNYHVKSRKHTNIFSEVLVTLAACSKSTNTRNFYELTYF